MAARGGGTSGGRLGHARRPWGATRLLAALALGLAALAGESAQGVDPALARAPLLAPAATLNVCPSGCPYSSIQDAINAANPGDTISVGAGTYTQVLTISTTLTIAGAGAGRTLIDGQGRGGTGISLLGGHATITALTVQHWNA